MVMLAKVSRSMNYCLRFLVGCDSFTLLEHVWAQAHLKRPQVHQQLERTPGHDAAQAAQSEDFAEKVKTTYHKQEKQTNEDYDIDRIHDR